jgi:hypothetical protein
VTVPGEAVRPVGKGEIDAEKVLLWFTVGDAGPVGELRVRAIPEVPTVTVTLFAIVLLLKLGSVVVV